MKPGLCVCSSFRWRTAVVLAVAFGTFEAATPADARGLEPPAAPPSLRVDLQPADQPHTRDSRPTDSATPIHQWLGSLRFDDGPDMFVQPPVRPDAAKPRAEAQRGYRGRRHGDRGVGGLVLGVIGGFAAGGAIGVAVGERYCHCEDPGLHGFLIGAPIGAVIGGFIGYAIAR